MIKLAFTGGNDIFAGLSILLVYFAVLIGVFLIIRKLVLWYYKVNVMVSEMEKQSKLLEVIAAHLDPVTTSKILNKVKTSTPGKSDLLKKFEEEKEKIG